MQIDLGYLCFIKIMYVYEMPDLTEFNCTDVIDKL